MFSPIIKDSDFVSIEIISRSLRGAVENTAEGREGMALGQYIAGMGFSNVGLGIVHSMAHPLGALYDTPHGVATAIILPTVMEYNAEYTGEKYDCKPYRWKFNESLQKSYKEEIKLDKDKRYIVAYVDKCRSGRDHQYLIYQFDGHLATYRELGFCTVVPDERR